ncbi:hypothetical protein BT63DRAFT_464214 [Microthyrium microscopicum]|uniref:Uncharacterized protein n=1 Tax=Microthyrium microscopicum TaxID=703497 RepID=A0A6A6TXZ9_9PEZI|nr:hypothetical protein BT63DRAFT_464214 [Microthyrium microscopicum]
MKTSVIAFWLPLLIDGSVIRLEPRQSVGILGQGGPMKKALKIEQLPSKLNVTDAKRVRITYGPYIIKGTKTAKGLGNARSMDSGGTSFANGVDTDFPRDITILKAYTDVQNKAGKRMELKDGIYNHHTVFFDLNNRHASPYTCAAGKVGSKMATVPVFAAGATETTVQVYMASSGDVKSGYYLNKTGSITNMIDLVNYNTEDQEVYTMTELEYVPGKPAGYHDAYMTLIDPGICGGPSGAAIHAPKGVNKFSINSSDILMNEPGHFVYTSGHMHDGGVNVILKVNDEIKCDSKALYGGEGHTTVVDGKTWQTIRETTSCNQAIKVKKGDRIYMQANYDVELHPSREMGGGHGGHGGMKWLSSAQAGSSMMDGGDAEQMALFAAYFSPDN